MTRQTLLFARHGNNFGPGDKVVWVGRENDLPLVEAGLAQAKAAAEALAAAGHLPDAIYCASLQRTKRFAAIIAAHLGMPAPCIDHRLDELDYGAWGGRSTAEIIAADPRAEAVIEAWNRSDQWPSYSFWRSNLAEIIAALQDFTDDLLAPDRHRTPLVVSSNGILRFLPRLLLQAEDHLSSFKMRTGHLGAIVRDDRRSRLLGWDLPPDRWSGFGLDSSPIDAGIHR